MNWVPVLGSPPSRNWKASDAQSPKDSHTESPQRRRRPNAAWSQSKGAGAGPRSSRAKGAPWRRAAGGWTTRPFANAGEQRLDAQRPQQEEAEEADDDYESDAEAQQNEEDGREAPAESASSSRGHPELASLPITSAAGVSSRGGSIAAFGSTRQRRMAWADMVSEGSESDIGDVAAYFNPNLLPTTTAASSSSSSPVAASHHSPAGSIADEIAAASGAAGTGPVGVEAAADENLGDVRCAASLSSSSAVTEACRMQWWSEEVQALARRMQELVELAPTSAQRVLVGDGAVAAPAGSAATPVVCQVKEPRSPQNECASASLSTLRAEESTLRAQVSSLRAEAEEHQLGATCEEAQEATQVRAQARMAAGRAAAAVAAAADSARKTSEQWRAAQARVAAAEACAAAAAADADATKEEARKRADEVAGQISKIRAAWASEKRAAERAEQALHHLTAAHASVQDLPSAREKHRTLEEAAESLEEACKQLQQSIEPLRVELAAVSRGEKQREREARIAELERECRKFMEEPTLICRDDGSRLPQDLAQAKASNQALLTELREARSSRDVAAANTEELRAKVAEEHSAFVERSSAVRDAADQLRWTEESAAGTAAEFQKRMDQMQVLERTRDDLDERAQTTRTKQAEVDAAVKDLTVARRQTEEKEGVIQWRLQHTVSQLRKDPKGEELLKHLQVDMMAVGKKPRSAGTAREKWVGERLARRDDALHDAEASTTTGDESIADGHDDTGTSKLSPSKMHRTVGELDD